jgi:hypothetical protein
LIDAPAWAVYILHADGDAFSGVRILSQLQTEAFPDIYPLVFVDLDYDHADIPANPEFFRAAAFSLRRSG